MSLVPQVKADRPAAQQVPTDAPDPPTAWEQGPVSVVVLDDVAALERYAAAWDDLAAAAVEPNVFYESWMLLPALRLLAGGDKVLVVLVFVHTPQRNKG